MEIYLEPIQVFEKNQRDNLGRFKKGHIPANKGKKCPEIANKT